MSYTLLLRLAAPLQSWGSSSKFDARYTEQMPTKSGIIGLLACAMGIRRSAPLDFFRDVKVGVRADQKGKLGVDYQVVRITKEDKRKDVKAQSWITYRHYLLDAVFLVVVEAPLDKLRQFADALQHPAFPLFLGRRSCPPAGQLVLGIVKKSMEEALQEEPWLASSWYRKRALQKQVRYLEALVETAPGTPGSFTKKDEPLSFDPHLRRYGFRNVIFRQVSLSAVYPEAQLETVHDPMQLLENDAYVSDKN